MALHEILKINDVVNITKLSESTLYRLIKNNQFPKGTSVGRSKLWLAEDVNNWVLENFGEVNEYPH
jgi:predicted DNA-binding transcriptional regulator AlpA